MKLEVSQETVRFVVHVAPNGGRAARGEGEEIAFNLRRLTGRDIRELSDLTVRMNKRGAPEHQIGGVARLKVLRSVVSCEGLTYPDGRTVEKLGPDEYDKLPGWLCEALLSEVNDLNGFDEGE